MSSGYFLTQKKIQGKCKLCSVFLISPQSKDTWKVLVNKSKVPKESFPRAVRKASHSQHVQAPHFGWGVTSASGGLSHGQNSSQLSSSVCSKTISREDCLLLLYQLATARTMRQARFYSCWYSRVPKLLAMF